MAEKQSGRPTDHQEHPYHVFCPGASIPQGIMGQSMMPQSQAMASMMMGGSQTLPGSAGMMLPQRADGKNLPAAMATGDDQRMTQSSQQDEQSWRLRQAIKKKHKISTSCRYYGGLHLEGHGPRQIVPRARRAEHITTSDEDFTTLRLTELTDEGIDFLCFIMFNVKPTTRLADLRCETWDDLGELLHREGRRIRASQPQRVPSLQFDLANVAAVAVQYGFPVGLLSPIAKSEISHMLGSAN